MRWPFLRAHDGFPYLWRFRFNLLYPLWLTPDDVLYLKLSRPPSTFSVAWGFSTSSPLTYTIWSLRSLKSRSAFDLSLLKNSPTQALSLLPSYLLSLDKIRKEPILVVSHNFDVFSFSSPLPSICSINRCTKTFALVHFNSRVGQCLLQRYGLLWFADTCHCLI